VRQERNKGEKGGKKIKKGRKTKRPEIVRQERNKEEKGG
jgi:hypothetical protein